MKTESAIREKLGMLSQWGRYSPVRQLDPRTMSAWLEEWRAGYLANLSEAWDEIYERDDVIPGVGWKRMDRPASCDWEVVSIDPDNPESDRHAEALREAYNNLTVTDAVDLDVTGGIELLIRQVMGSVGWKYAVHEIIWQPGTVFTAELRRVPLRHFERTTGRLRFAPGGGGSGQEMIPGEWMVSASDAPPLMKATGIAYLYKILPLRDWLTYSETLGLMFLIFKTRATPGSQEWKDAEDAVAKLAGVFGMVASEGTEVERMGAGSGELPYGPLIERMDRRITALWRGADLSSMSAQDGRGASVQADEGRLLLEGDCSFVASKLNIGFGRHVIRYRFGENVRPLAYLKINPPADIDEEREQKKLSLALTDGVPISLGQYRETLGLRTPASEEDTLHAPAVTSPPSDPANPLAFNEAAVPDPDALDDYVGLSEEMVGRVLVRSHEDLIQRMAALLKIEDEETLLRELEEIRRDLPGEFSEAMPELTDAFEAIEGTALVEGFLEGEIGR